MGKKLPYKPRKRFYDAEKIAWINEHINDDMTIEELAEIFSARFQRKVNGRALNKAINKYCGYKPRPKTIHMPSKNAVGTVIVSKDGKRPRVKTENGYVEAQGYFKKLYGIPNNKLIVNLNGDFSDFSEDNIQAVSRGLYRALHFRKWIFKDKEKTKAAILLCELYLLLPELAHNEAQFLKAKKARRCNA